MSTLMSEQNKEPEDIAEDIAPMKKKISKNHPESSLYARVKVEKFNAFLRQSLKN